MPIPESITVNLKKNDKKRIVSADELVLVSHSLCASSLKSSVLYFCPVLSTAELYDHKIVVFGDQKLESIFGPVWLQ
jgi:hypothetical protein